MCFYVRNNDKQAVLYVAKQDIVCYKMLYCSENIISSPYQYFIYELNKLYRIKGDICRAIRKDNIYGYNTKKGWRKDYPIASIHRGFHSYKSLEIAKEERIWRAYNGCKIYKCIIPKGSEFFVNDREYVSNQIIVVK